MGVLSKYFPSAELQQTNPLRQTGYTTFTERAPRFTTWNGSMYEHPLTRAAIERFAVACSKLKPEVVGSKSCKPNIRKLFETWPNDLMTWPAFLARVATIYEMDTTAFIVPALDRSLNTVALFPMKPAYTEIVDYDGEPWCVFHTYSGELLAIEYRRCAVISKFQYLSDFFGAGNEVMGPTLGLMDAQRQAEEQAVQNGARIRFIGKVNGMTHGEDLNKLREQFYEDNLSEKNYTGLLMYSNNIQEVTQIKEDRFIIDQEEMDRVSRQVYDYLGTNEEILQNKYNEESYGAWYEGKVEPFAVMVSEAITKAHYTVTERRKGNYVMFSSSKLAYATNTSKRNMIRDLSDRGFISLNEGREILQLPPVEGGDILMARGEYKVVNSGTEADQQSVTEIDTESDVGRDERDTDENEYQ